MFELKGQPILESLAKQEMSRYTMHKAGNTKRSIDDSIDIRHVALSVEPDMNTGSILKGSVKFAFRTLSNINSLEFDLRKPLKVDSVIYHSSNIAFTHSSSHLLNVSLGATVVKGVDDSISVYYSGMPDMSTRSYSRNVNISGPNISTLSQPYGAHFWWPCKEGLYDKIDSIDIRLTVDTPFYAVSNGRLLDIDTTGAKRTFHYSHSYPIVTYLVAISFSKYSIYKDQMTLPTSGKQMDIIHHVFPHNDDLTNRNRTAETVPIMRLFDSLFGSYPFEREIYGHAQFGWSGGMEHQTMSFMTNFNYDLVAHELAHQWFGDMVTCGSWKDIWLNEGFATYLNLLCYDFLKPESEWRGVIKDTREDVLSEPGGSVYAYDTSSVPTLFNYRTTYQKGAMVMHQLRGLIGDDAFFSGLRAYLKDTSLAYGFARQDNLKQHLELSSGMNLEDYFNDWIMGEGYPQYDMSWTQKGKLFKLDIVQTPSVSTAPLFNVPIPIKLIGANDEDTLNVPISSLFTNFEKEIDFKIKEVIVDPDNYLLAKFNLRFPLPDVASVSLYPNPFNGYLYFVPEDFDISGWELVDMQGKTVLDKTYFGTFGKGNIESIETSALADGIYFLRLIGVERTVVKKVIKI